MAEVVGMGPGVKVIRNRSMSLVSGFPGARLDGAEDEMVIHLGPRRSEDIGAWDTKQIVDPKAERGLLPRRRLGVQQFASVLLHDHVSPTRRLGEGHEKLLIPDQGWEVHQRGEVCVETQHGEG